MNNTKEKLAQRQLIYSILALFYRGELAKGLDILQSTDILQQLSDYSSDPLMKSSTYILIKEIETNKDNSNYAKLLLEDYQRLFVGPDHIFAPLWESVYITKDRIIFDESELEIRRLYNKSGLDVKKTEPADHLSLELGFMARLCFEIKIDLTLITDQRLVKQKQFLKEHLLKWTLYLKESINEHALTQFWISFSEITRSWLVMDLFELEKILEIRDNN